MKKHNNNNNIVTVLLLLSLLQKTCHGWGTEGHEMVANIAWHRLSDTTRETVVQILNLTTPVTQGSPLADVADWADRVRHYMPWSAGLHYIDIRDDEITHGCHYYDNNNNNSTTLVGLDSNCHFDYARDCPQDQCVAGAIVNYTTQLQSYNNMMDRTTAAAAAESSMSLRRASTSQNNNNNNNYNHHHNDNGEAQKEALEFLIHFVGDIHQPLHCSRQSDKGGNDISVHFDLLLFLLADKQQPPLSRRNINDNNTLDDRSQSHSHSHHGWNLHSVWDTGLIDVALERYYNNSREVMEASLIQQIMDDPTMVPRYLDAAAGGDGETRISITTTTTTKWGQEGWRLAMQYAYQLNDMQEVQPGDILGEEYFLTRLAVVQERLMAAGIRLAATLEHVLSSSSSSDHYHHHPSSSPETTTTNDMSNNNYLVPHQPTLLSLWKLLHLPYIG